MALAKAPSFTAGLKEGVQSQSEALLRSQSGQALPLNVAGGGAISGGGVRKRTRVEAASSTTKVIPAGTGSSLPVKDVPGSAETGSSLPVKDVPRSARTGSCLHVKDVPGSYGLPFFGQLKDRLDYFWFQGSKAFFASRIEKYSTVFRTHIPPGWPDGRVVILCDQKSFPVLYDMEKVYKMDILTGTYKSDASFTGGYRVLPYLDPSEERHTKLKGFCFDVLRSNGQRFLPEFHRAITEAYAVWEGQLLKDGKADFKAECAQFTFDFLLQAIAHHDPVGPGEASLGASGTSNLTTWIALQLAPLLTSGVLPKWLDELLLHTFRLPSWPAQGGYNKVYKFLETYATDMVEIATKQHGLEKEDALRNLLFYIHYNAHAGINVLYPNIIRYLNGNLELQKELADEVRAVVKANGGSLTRKAIEEMKLVGSVVYEVLHIAPPVALQYGRAKKDFVLESWDGAFQMKKGELRGGGFQPYATKDPRVFSEPDTFKPKRFLGEKGEKLLQYVLLSNGPETTSPTTSNKQCAGKDFVIFITSVFVAKFFLRYDSFQADDSLAFTKLNVAASA